MKIKLLVSSLTIVSCIGLIACSGGNYSRVNEKQRTPSDIKISQLDMEKKTIDLRFEYRTYDKKTLEKITCDIDFNAGSAKLTVNQVPEIKLDAFSTEIFGFKNIEIISDEALKELNTINYSLSCDLYYDKGSEVVFEKSVLHQVPGSQSSYR